MSSDQTKQRILVVEDDEAIARLLERALSATYQVTVAKDGGEALALATRLVPALILLDVMMPGIDGYQVAERIRLLPALKRVPLIFITARDAPMDHIRGIQVGAKHYVTKPFKMSDVLDKVKRALK